MGVIHDGYGRGIDENNPLPIKETKGYITPVDIQARMTHLIQTQAGVSILPNATNQGAWIDSHVDGSPLTYLGVTVNMTGGIGMQVTVDFSHDGVNFFSFYSFPGTSSAGFSTIDDVKLPTRYFRVNVKNNDTTNPKTTTAYAYLKA